MANTVTCIDMNGKSYEVPVESLEWRPSVYGIIIRDGNILLSRQFGDRYDLPGGGLGLAEAPEDGVLREVKEETGIDVQNPVLVGATDSFFQSAHSENKSYHCILMYFACDVAGGELSTDGFDEYEKQYAAMAEWIPLDRLDTLRLATTVDYRPFVTMALKRGRPSIQP